MSSQFIEKPKNETSVEDTRLYLLAGGIFALTMGILFALFTTTHIQDLQTLAEFPGMLWSFACGKPVEGGPVLPLLLSLSIVSLLASAILFGWRWWLGRSR
ncbi:MAG: hypothetical protein KC496_03870 [Anaerolineae bacterium]|nr:hypothetical protein [Anaerolineae bacterium]